MTDDTVRRTFRRKRTWNAIKRAGLPGIIALYIGFTVAVVLWISHDGGIPLSAIFATIGAFVLACAVIVGMTLRASR